MSHKYHISQGMETNHKLFSNRCPSLFSLKLLRNWKFLSPWSKARDKFVTSVVGKKTAWAGSQTTQYQTFLWKVCATKLWRNTLQCLSFTWFFLGGGMTWQGVRIFSKILDAYICKCIYVYMNVGGSDSYFLFIQTNFLPLCGHWTWVSTTSHQQHFWPH